MKIRTLVENTCCRDDLSAEHGLSLYIETGSHRILFDAGQSRLFIDNAAKMGVDLRLTELAILSHGHYDHGGGLPAFLELNQTAPVYASADAFSPHYSSPERFIGLPLPLSRHRQMVAVKGTLSLFPGITLYPAGNVPCIYPTSGQGMLREENGKLIPDDFRHEQYLLLEENGKKILITGCSHRGILNIVAHFMPDVLIGGFHFSKLSTDSKELSYAAQILSGFTTTYYTGHCTGTAQYKKLKEVLGDRLHLLTTGSDLQL